MTRQFDLFAGVAGADLVRRRESNPAASSSPHMLNGDRTVWLGM
jgi:hypothetical protein